MASYHCILCIVITCLWTSAAAAENNISYKHEIICPKTQGITLGAKDDGTCYLYFTKQVNYSVARINCKEINGKLIQSKDKHFVKDMMFKDKLYNLFWLKQKKDKIYCPALLLLNTQTHYEQCRMKLQYICKVKGAIAVAQQMTNIQARKYCRKTYRTQMLSPNEKEWKYITGWINQHKGITNSSHISLLWVGIISVRANSFVRAHTREKVSAQEFPFPLKERKGAHKQYFALHHTGNDYMIFGLTKTDKAYFICGKLTNDSVITHSCAFQELGNISDGNAQDESPRSPINYILPIAVLLLIGLIGIVAAFVRKNRTTPLSLSNKTYGTAKIRRKLGRGKRFQGHKQNTNIWGLTKSTPSKRAKQIEIKVVSGQDNKSANVTSLSYRSTIGEDGYTIVNNLDKSVGIEKKIPGTKPIHNITPSMEGQTKTKNDGYETPILNLGYISFSTDEIDSSEDETKIKQRIRRPKKLIRCKGYDSKSSTDTPDKGDLNNQPNIYESIKK